MLCAVCFGYGWSSPVSLWIIVTAEAEEAGGPGVCPVAFWDLDGPELPPPAWCPPDRALFLCSRDPRRAIASYSFHPTGFLLKPVSMEHLWEAMLRCSRLWFSALMRLEIYNGRVKIGIPFQQSALRGGRPPGLPDPHDPSTASLPGSHCTGWNSSSRRRSSYGASAASWSISSYVQRSLQGIFLQLYNGAEMPDRAAEYEELCWRLTAGFCQLRYGAADNALWQDGEDKGEETVVPEISIAICDDLDSRADQPGQNGTVPMRRRMGFPSRLRLYSSGERLLAALQRPEPIHLLFLDIYMPGLPGMETARRIRAAGNPTVYCFRHRQPGARDGEL